MGYFDRLNELDKARCKATAALEAELVDVYPLGVDVWFKIMTGQYNFSSGRVISHEAPFVRVRMDTPAQKVVDVHFAELTPDMPVELKSDGV